MRISNNDMIYNAVILILAINSLKRKQNVNLLVLVVKQLSATLISK